MNNKLKDFFSKAISIGLHGELPDSTRVAIQLGTLDAYWSFACAGIYLFLAWYQNANLLFYVHLLSMIGYIGGIWLFTLRRYDLGRYLIHSICIVEVYLTVDSYPSTSGIELFFFPTLMIPFITFSVHEQWKGNIQVIMACLAYVLQQYLGTGYFFPVLDKTPVDKMVAIVLVVSYVPLILGFLRWQVKATNAKLIREQEKNLQASTMKIIGEMSVEIAHEINNPLQKLSLQLAVLKEKGSLTADETKKMEETISQMGTMVQGLKNLNKIVESQKEEFLFSKVMEHILIVSSDRIKEYGVQIRITGDTNLKIYGHSVQISQVLMNLLNNALESVKYLKEKWITIEVSEKNHFLQLAVRT